MVSMLLRVLDPRSLLLNRLPRRCSAALSRPCSSRRRPFVVRRSLRGIPSQCALPRLFLAFCVRRLSVSPAHLCSVSLPLSASLCLSLPLSSSSLLTRVPHSERFSVQFLFPVFFRRRSFSPSHCPFFFFFFFFSSFFFFSVFFFLFVLFVRFRCLFFFFFTPFARRVRRADFRARGTRSAACGARGAVETVRACSSVPRVPGRWTRGRGDVAGRTCAHRPPFFFSRIGRV